MGLVTMRSNPLALPWGPHSPAGISALVKQTARVKGELSCRQALRHRSAAGIQRESSLRKSDVPQDHSCSPTCLSTCQRRRLTFLYRWISRPRCHFTSAAAAKSTAKEQATAGGGGIGGNRNESFVDVPVKPKPRKFFDAKTFRELIRACKENEIREEEKRIRHQYARPPPEGWDIAEFLRRVGLEESASSIASHFNSWGAFVCASPEDLMAIESLTNPQRRLLLRHLRLFNNGLWPENSYDDYLERFQAEPLKREGQPWTEEEDARLLELAEQYDANFGDPWLYISWEMQRDFEDVHKRYLDLVVIPKNKKRKCEFVLSKCLRPLYFSRYFKILPSTLVIVPTAKHFNTESSSQFAIPTPFRCLRD